MSCVCFGGGVRVSYGTRVWRWGGGGVALFCIIVRSKKASLPLNTGNSEARRRGGKGGRERASEMRETGVL